MNWASSILGSSFDFSVAGLNGLAQRTRVNAENLANVDTPGYRAQTVNFESSLQAALSGDGGGGGLRGDAPSGVAASIDGAAMMPVSANTTSSSDVPGNNVDRIRVTTQMAEDSLRFRVLTQRINTKISSAKTVIQYMSS